MQYISTGKAAELCAVTPDTILKWIKSGKLTARRTAGGHHRIPMESLEAFLREAAEEEAAPVETDFQYCWEYHAPEEKIPEECQQCLAFKSRALRCFELSTLTPEAGFGGLFCGTSCEACEYFQQLREPAPVLVFTDDPELQQTLQQDHDAARMVLQFTRNEYEGATLIDSFRPDYVVVDSTSLGERCQDLCRHIVQDPRIPDVRIILAVAPEQRRREERTGIYPCLGKPFTAQQLETQIEKMRRIEREV